MRYKNQDIVLISMKNLKKNPMFVFLMVLTISAAVGLQTWRTLFNNFAVEAAGLEGNHIGVINSVREIPGFLSLLVVFVIIFIKEYHLSVLSILVLGIGVAATGLFPSYAGLVITTMVMSFGFHYFETTNQSLTLQYFDENTAPLVFGKLRSLAAVTNIAVGVLIYLVMPILSYKQVYLGIGSLVAVVALWAFWQNPADQNRVPQRKKMIVRRKYWLFYFLTFMAGARRQIFVSFAVFLLVKKFDFTVQEITVLFVVNNLINYFLSPLIGKSIVRFGERKVLSLEYFSLIFVFVAYAIVNSKIAVACLYIADHIFFNFAIAIRTYFQKVADPRDTAPSMAVGFTINHIAAVVLPALGGVLWLIDYRIPFLTGAAFSFISLIAVQQIQIKRRPL